MELRIKGTFIEGHIIDYTDVDCNVAIFETTTGCVKVAHDQLTELTKQKMIEKVEKFSMKVFCSKKEDKGIWYILSAISGYLLSFLLR